MTSGDTTTSLAQQMGELLQAERDLGRKPTQREQIWLWRLRRALYFRVASECSDEGHLSAAAAANMAAGHAVTMQHRIAGIGVCPHCWAVDLVEAMNVNGDGTAWRCGDCGHNWVTPPGVERPGDLLADTRRVL